MKIRVFWDEDAVYVVAHSADDAELVYAEHVGAVDSFGMLQFSAFPEDQEISIRVWVEGPEAGQIAPADEAEQPGIQSLKQPAKAWALQCGRGFLCTTDF